MGAVYPAKKEKVGLGKVGVFVFVFLLEGLIVDDTTNRKKVNLVK